MRSITLRSIVYPTLKYKFLTIHRNHHRFMSCFSHRTPYSQRTGHVYFFMKNICQVYYADNTWAHYSSKVRSFRSSLVVQQVKALAPSLQQLGSLLWHGFGPVTSTCCRHGQKKKNKLSLYIKTADCQESQELFISLMWIGKVNWLAKISWPELDLGGPGSTPRHLSLLYHSAAEGPPWPLFEGRLLTT